MLLVWVVCTLMARLSCHFRHSRLLGCIPIRKICLEGNWAYSAWWKRDDGPIPIVQESGCFQMDSHVILPRCLLYANLPRMLDIRLAFHPRRSLKITVYWPSRLGRTSKWLEAMVTLEGDLVHRSFNITRFWIRNRCDKIRRKRHWLQQVLRSRMEEK